MFTLIWLLHFRDLFAKLTAEELEAGWAEENEEDIPNFGDSKSTYEEVTCNSNGTMKKMLIKVLKFV